MYLSSNVSNEFIIYRETNNAGADETNPSFTFLLGSSASGMGEGNGTLSSYSNKTAKYAVGGSGGSAATQDEANKEAAPVTVGKYDQSEVNAYKGGNIKANSDPSTNLGVSQYSAACNTHTKVLTSL